MGNNSIQVILFRDGIVRSYPLQDSFRVRVVFTSVCSQKEAIFTDYWSITQSVKLCEDAERSLKIDNAGGNSVISEMMSIEYFSRVYKAKEILLEMEVEYWIDYKMVDFVCTIPFYGGRVGISVTRAMGYPSPADFTYKKALYLLKKKLYGLIVSRNGVTKKHSFYRSILHVWCQTSTIAYFVQEAYASFDIEDYGLDIKGVVILQLTVCSHPALYRDYLPEKWLS